MTSRRLELLYDAHAQSMFAFLLHLTRCEHRTRDLLQEVFLHLAQRPLPLWEKPRPYLLRIAHNLWIDQVRREAAQIRTLEAEAASVIFTPPDLGDPELNAQIAAAVATLPPEQRAVVHLKIWEGLTFREIGTTLRIPTHTAASRYRYALDKLRDAIRLSLENERR